MTSMFDVVLSLIIGGMLIISMFTAMTTIQAHAINMGIAQNLIRTSQGPQGIADIIGDYYLANIGVGGVGTPIISATSTSFRFWSNINDPTSGAKVNADVTIGQVGTSTNRYLLVYRNGVTANRLYGPFKLANSGIRIRYYDKDDNLIPNANTAKDQIRSVEIGFYVEREGINVSSNTPRNILNYVYIRKYLINLYK